MNKVTNHVTTNNSLEPSVPGAPKKENRPLTPLESVVGGALAGLVEVTVDQPLVSLKVEWQRRDANAGLKNVLKEVASDPAGKLKPVVKRLYAGWASNAAGMAVATAGQVLVKEALANSQTDHGKKPLTEEQQFGNAVAAGVVTSAVASPSEMVTNNYQKQTKEFAALSAQGKAPGPRPTYGATVKGLYARYGATGFTRGLVGTAFRDGGFTAAYAAGGPFFKKKFQPYLSDDTASTVAGGVAAGVLGATVTHPFDTWKTQRQSGMKTGFWPNGGFKKTVSTAFETARKTHGLAGATKAAAKAAVEVPFGGFGARTARVVSAVVLLTLLLEKFSETVQQHDP